MEFRVLGPLVVSEAEERLPFDRAGPRALLALLLLHRNTTVETSRIVEELWAGAPPASATKIVQSYVSQLRKRLGPERLETHASGYLLRVGPDELDADRFERLVEEARQAGPGTARELLVEALSLWRGPAFDDVRYLEFAHWEAERLDELRLSANEDRIDAELALGRHAPLTAELPRLVREHPLRERLHGQLMLALYRSGRQAEALETYQRARRTLTDELGLEPSPPLQRLEQAVLRHDAELDAPVATRVADAAPPDRVAPKPTQLGRRMRPRSLLLAGVALVAAAVAAGAYELAQGSSPALLVRTNAVGVIDPATNKVVGIVPAGNSPDAIAAGDGGIWVVNSTEQSLDRIDPSSLRVVRKFGGLRNPTDVATGRKGVWVATLSNEVLRLDPSQNLLGPATSLAKTNRLLENETTRVTAGSSSVWAASTGEVSRLEPRPAFSIPIRRFACCKAIAVGQGAVWATQQFGLVRIDPKARSLTPIKLPFESSSIATGAGGVWVADNTEDTVWRIDPRTNEIRTTIDVGQHPAGVAVGGGSVWVAGTNGVVSRIDPSTDRVVARIHTGNTPRAIAFGYRRVWVTVD